MPDSTAIYRAEYTGSAITDCSGYLKRVSTRLNLGLPNLRADGLIEYIASNWVLLGQGESGGPVARQAASNGYVVVALLKAGDHYPWHPNPRTHKFDDGKIPHPYHSGHVAVVLGTPTGGYPYIICGSSDPNGNGRSDGSKQVYARGAHSPWREVDAPNVKYYRTSSTVPILTETR